MAAVLQALQHDAFRFATTIDEKKMNGLMRLHTIAAARGDGLRPELVALFRKSANAIGADPKIEQLSSYRTNSAIQAGPNPVASVNGAMPEGVLMFPGHKSARADATPAPPHNLRGTQCTSR